MKQVAAILLVVSALMLHSCANQKYYAKGEYSFYHDVQGNLGTAFLRTDGVYVLDRIVTDEAGRQFGAIKTTDVFKFYPGRQVSKVLFTDSKLQSPGTYVAAFNERITKHAENGNATLFEGYYRQKGDSIVLQQVSAPLRQFYYTYGYFKRDSLIIVSQTHVSSGEFAAKHYSTLYKAFYRFVHTGEAGYLSPDW